MLTDPQREFLAAPVRSMRFFVGALAAGVVLFALFAVTIRFSVLAGDADDDVNGEPDTPQMAYIAAGLAAAGIVAWAVVPGLVTGGMRQAIVAGDRKRLATISPDSQREELGDVGPLTAIYQIKLTIAAFILEGAAFFNLISYMLEGQTLSLIVTGVLLLLLLTQFPTFSKLESWIEGQRATIDQLRQMQSYDEQ